MLYSRWICTVPEGQDGAQMKADTRQIIHLYQNNLKGQTTDLKREEHTIPLLIWIDLTRLCPGLVPQGILQELSGVVQTG